jgi:hypothetical protein
VNARDDSATGAITKVDVVVVMSGTNGAPTDKQLNRKGDSGLRWACGASCAAFARERVHLRFAWPVKVSLFGFVLH